MLNQEQVQDLSMQQTAAAVDAAFSVMDTFNLSSKPSLMVCGSDVTDATYILSTLPMNLAMAAGSFT